MYFRANNTRAQGLSVEFTGVEDLDVSLQFRTVSSGTPRLCA
ncbi:hypothetical protein [Streptomyces sp. ISL-1]|nr:hypothetical protein [Streptomyces sp. ISL-1]